MPNPLLLGAAISVAVLQIAHPSDAAYVPIRRNQGDDSSGSDVTYESVYSNSQFDSYLSGIYTDYFNRFQVQSSGKVAQGTPYQTVTFANSSELTLDSSALPTSSIDISSCENYPSCCSFESTSCQAWFSFFDFCRSSCVGDAKCTAVEVRMADGTCALYDGRLGCIVTDDSKTSEDSIVFAWDRALSNGVSIPEGYTEANAYPSDTVKPIKTVPVTAEPCGADYTSVRDQNVADCTAKCSADAKCSAFGYKIDPETGDASCILYGNLKGDWSFGYDVAAFYLKNETVNCNGNKGEYFSYESYDESMASPGCKPLLKEGDKCSEDYLYINDLTNDNHGCALGLACVDEDRVKEITKCRVPGTFSEEATDQLSADWTFVGKALPNTADGANTTDVLYFDMRAHNWAYVKDVGSACYDLCGSADLTRKCWAYELNAETQQCILAYSAICASSLVANENAAVIMTQPSWDFDSLMYSGAGEGFEPRNELAGFQKLDGFIPVVPTEPNDNVKIVDIPCADFFSGDMLSIVTEKCMDECKKWEGCHTVLLRGKENSCVLFAGDQGKTLAVGNKGDTLVFADPAKMGCTDQEFYGYLEEDHNKYSSVKYANDSWVPEWDEVLAERGFADGGNAESVLVKVNYNPKNATVLATCISYLKENVICGLEGTIGGQFSSLFPYNKREGGSEFYGCEPGTQCSGSSTFTDCTADDGSCSLEVNEVAVCKVPAESQDF